MQTKFLDSHFIKFTL